MKKKIKTWLIHLLSGVTVAENRTINNISFLIGMRDACIDIRDYADSLYGKPADDDVRVYMWTTRTSYA